MNLLKRICLVALLGLLAFASACAQGARPESPVSLGPIMPVAAETDDATCFMPLSPEHRQLLTPYVTQQPGTGQNVCVLEQEPDGEFEQQYYNEGDNFPDFWYYALLARTAETPVFSTGIIAEPTLVERTALLYVVYMSKYGSPYTAYELDSHTGKWSARKADKALKVKHVRYGAGAPVQLNKAATPPAAPPNYKKPQAPPAPQGSGTVGQAAEKKNNAPAPVQTQQQSKSTSKSSSSSSGSRKSK